MPVSIVVGGQFGSEGKGKVALEIVRRDRTVLRLYGWGAQIPGTLLSVPMEGRLCLGNCLLQQSMAQCKLCFLRAVTSIWTSSGAN
jgi:hypothetical protein